MDDLESLRPMQDAINRMHDHLAALTAPLPTPTVEHMSEPRFPVGQKLRSNLSGTVWEIVADYYYDPEYVELVPVVANYRYYVVSANGEDDIMEHGVIASATTPIPDDEEPSP